MKKLSDKKIHRYQNSQISQFTDKKSNPLSCLARVQLIQLRSSFTHIYSSLSCVVHSTTQSHSAAQLTQLRSLISCVVHSYSSLIQLTHTSHSYSSLIQLTHIAYSYSLLNCVAYLVAQLINVCSSLICVAHQFVQLINLISSFVQFNQKKQLRKILRIELIT